MAKSKKEAPALEGSVSRAIDFNLKKEDLMLLILEGRKEVMEKEIGNLQDMKAKALAELKKSEEHLLDAVKKLTAKSLNKDTEKLAKMMLPDGVEFKPEELFSIEIGTVYTGPEYKDYAVRQVGSIGTAGGFIKTELVGKIKFNVPNSTEVTFKYNLVGRSFADKNPLFNRKDAPKCAPYSTSDCSGEIVILSETLSESFIQGTDEYKKCYKQAEEVGKISTLLADILTEYELFNRNQPRAKAQLIKSVLGRDEAGLALLENIKDASKGLKLLS